MKNEHNKFHIWINHFVHEPRRCFASKWILMQTWNDTFHIAMIVLFHLQLQYVISSILSYCILLYKSHILFFYQLVQLLLLYQNNLICFCFSFLNDRFNPGIFQFFHVKKLLNHLKALNQMIDNLGFYLIIWANHKNKCQY